MTVARQATAKRLVQHAGQISGMLAMQLAVRVLALLPVWLPFIRTQAKQLFSLFPSCIWLIAVYVFAVFPLRFHGALTLTKTVRIKDSRSLRAAAYPQLLLAGSLRMVIGLIWALPFAWMLYRLYQYVFVFDGPRFSRDFIALGSHFTASTVVEEQFRIGSLIYLGGLLLTLLLALYGWWRGVPYDFQLVGNTSALQAYRTARRVRRRCRGGLRRNALVHTLLFLSSIILPIAYLYIRLSNLLTGQPMQDLQLIYVYLQAGMISDGTLLVALLLFLLPYLPFLPYRKARNADVVVNCYDDGR